MISNQVIPALEKRKSHKLDISDEIKQEWLQNSLSALKAIEPSKAFPFLDLLRIGLLDSSVAEELAQSELILIALVEHGSKLVNTEDSFPKPLLITYIRMLANAIYTPSLAEAIVAEAFTTDSSVSTVNVMKILIRGLLDADTGVRTSGASLAFNYTRYVSGRRVSWLSSDVRSLESEEWACEVVSALIECLNNETASGVG